MSIARNATRRQRRHWVFLSLATAAAAVFGCASRPPATVPAVEPQHALRPQQPTAPPAPEKPVVPQPDAKAAGGEDETAKALEERARADASLKASQAAAVKLQQELKAARENLRRWHNAYKASQAQADALQKTAAALKERNDALHRQHAEATAALQDAQARLAAQPQAVPQGLLEAPNIQPIPDLPSAPAGAPVGSPPLGVLRDVRPFRGRPYATLSAGHDAGVRRGMRLGLADPRTGAPAGVVTIDEVGPAESGGVVEGANPGGLRAGLTVHAIADLAR